MKSGQEALKVVQAQAVFTLQYFTTIVNADEPNATIAAKIIADFTTKYNAQTAAVVAGIIADETPVVDLTKSLV